MKGCYFMTEAVTLANESIRLAQEDYNITVFSDSSITPKPLNRICNLCQQIVERMLKALYLALGKEARHTHDLGLLIAELEDNGLVFKDTLKDYADTLTPFGVKARYPFELEIDEQDERLAISYMKTLCKDINNKLEALNIEGLSQIRLDN